ncbi:hypothetical protein ACHAPT_004177 [Fusarium lateritium]
MDSWTTERVQGDYRYLHEGWYNSTLRYRSEVETDKSTLPAESSSKPSPAYESLALSRSEFRILLLQPSEDFNAPLASRLTRCNLDAPPKYECLSYVWGTAERTKAMTVNEETLYITPNLDSILRHLRLPSQPRPLWVDAICINQSDKQERSAQVPRMKDIYASCSRDLVWVGPYKSDEYSHGLEVLERGLAIMEQMESFERGPVEDEFALYAEWRQRLMGHRAKGVLRLTRDEVDALTHVLSDSPVWGRLWVMQEVSCAPELVLVAGRHTLDWRVIPSFLGDTQLADAFHAPFSHNEERQVTEVFSTAQVIEHQRDIVQSGYTSNLLDVLARFRWTKATDPRDKIYGLLGLVSHHDIVVDYNKTPQQVYTDVAVSLINNRGNLDILCQSPWSDLVYRMPDLPSWVPDFTCPGHPIPLFAQRSIFAAGAENCTVPCRVLGNRGLLVHGVNIDRVGPILPHTDDVDNYKLEHKYSGRDGQYIDRHGSMFTIPRDWMKLYFGDGLHESTYANGESCLQAFWRTLVADCKCYPIERLSRDDISQGNAIFGALLRGTEPDDMRKLIEEEPGRSIWAMWDRMVLYWTFMATEKGFYAMVMCGVRQGDVIAVLDGAKVPVVLREAPGDASGREARYQIVSTAYVHGFMDGEGYDWAKDGRLQTQEFLLV